MPTRKQRRRHQKALRHEYEYVYLDEEGNEVPVDPSELRPEKNGQRDSKPRKGSSGKAAAGRGTSGRRKIEPLLQQVFPAVFLIAFFIPFSYFTDSLAYRMFQKRLARRDSAKTR